MSTRHRLAVENPSGLKYSHTNQSARQVFDALHNSIPSAAVPDVSDLDRITFSIPWIPSSLGVLLRNWKVRNREMHTCANWIAIAVGKKTIPETKRVRVTIQMFRSRMLDRDNAWGSAGKIVFDGLKKCGYIVDDSEQWLEPIMMPVKIDAKNHRTEIQIERLS